jgi:hypothetical protein
MHPYGSRAQLASVELLVHIGPTKVHTGSVWQLQAADPADPVQVWYALGHVAGGPYAQHPLLP